MPLPGLWTTSYSGWMRVLPWPEQQPGESDYYYSARSRGLPPMVVAHRWKPPIGRENSRFEEADGFVPFTALVLMEFHANGGLTGEIQMNQSAEKVQTFPMTGDYQISRNASFNVYSGFFLTKHQNPWNDAVDYAVENTYKFHMPTNDKVDFHWSDGSYDAAWKTNEFEAKTIVPSVDPFLPPIVGATLKRVTLAPPLRFGETPVTDTRPHHHL
jgi:hypothetical protein